MKKEFKGHANKGGVYKITNTINGKIYIGSAKGFKKRAYQHTSSLKNGKHQNKHLQASFNKHGTDAFLFEVIEVVPGDKLARTTREQELIDEQLENWEKCYNFKKKTVVKDRSCWSKSPELTKTRYRQTSLKRYGVTHWAKTSEAKKVLRKGGEHKPTPEAIEKAASKRRGRKYTKELAEKMTALRGTPENRKRMSEWSKAKWQDPEYREAQIQRFKEFRHDEASKAKMRKAKLGKKQTPEHIENERLTRIGKKLPPRSKEYREKMSRAKKGKPIHTDAFKRRMSLLRKGKAPLGVEKLKKTVYQFNLDSEFIRSWPSASDVARELGIAASSICNCCNKKQKTAGGFLWKYKVNN